MLNDKTLSVDPIPFDPAEFDDADDIIAGLNDDDARALIDGLNAGGKE